MGEVKTLWYTEEMVEDAAKEVYGIPENWDHMIVPEDREGFREDARRVFDAITPQMRKLLAEQYAAGYEYCLQRVREQLGGIDDEVDHALAALKPPPKEGE